MSYLYADPFVWAVAFLMLCLAWIVVKAVNEEVDRECRKSKVGEIEDKGKRRKR